jgi:hypothetical protein
MPDVRKIDPVEAAWEDLRTAIADEALALPVGYATLLQLASYPPGEWIDPPRAHGAGRLAVLHPDWIERQPIVRRGRRAYLYRLTEEGRRIAVLLSEER